MLVCCAWVAISLRFIYGEGTAESSDTHIFNLLEKLLSCFPKMAAIFPPTAFENLWHATSSPTLDIVKLFHLGKLMGGNFIFYWVLIFVNHNFSF